jgi:hypothetical protein
MKIRRRQTTGATLSVRFLITSSGVPKRFGMLPKLCTNKNVSCPKLFGNSR